MGNKVQKFVEEVRKITHDYISISEVEQQHEIDKLINYMIEILQDKKLSIKELQSIQNSIARSSNINILKDKLNEFYNKNFSVLSDKQRQNFQDKFQIIQAGKRFLFTIKQQEELDILIKAVENANDNELSSAIDKLKDRISNFLSNDDISRKFEIFIKKAAESFDNKWKKKNYIHPIVFKTLIKIIVKNVEEKIIVVSIKHPINDSGLEQKLKTEFEQKLKNLLTQMLNIPDNAKLSVTSSDEYNVFIKCATALYDRVYEEEWRRIYDEQIFSEAATQRRQKQRVYMNEEQKKAFDIKEMNIMIYKCIFIFMNFIKILYGYLMKLLDKFDLLSEESQIFYIKNSSSDWYEYVAEKGSIVVREHNLSPLNTE